jgi:hypothetical protein
MSKPELTIVVPGIRPHRWEAFYASLTKSINKDRFELIFVGPYEPPSSLNERHIKYVRDWGCPTRCLQIGVLLAEAPIFTWASDDGIFYESAVDKALDKYIEIDEEKSGMTMKYNEGGHYHTDDYWRPWFHSGMRMAGIPQDAITMLIGMMRTKYFYELGGFDCRMQHINMTCHDISLRMLNDGGNIYLAPYHIANYDWKPNCLEGPDGDHLPVWKTDSENDEPLFRSIYSKPCPERIHIDLQNWKDSESVWSRRFT